MLLPSAAGPHSMPPTAPPSPIRDCQRVWPFRSGSIAYTIADFCPSSNARFPVGSVTSIEDAAKSKSGPFESGQLILSVRKHELFHASLAVNCLDHKISPVDIFSATTASLIDVGGSE